MYDYVDGDSGIYHYKRGQIWYADFYANDKRVQQSTGTASRRQAQKYVDVRLSEVHRGVYVKTVHVPLPTFGSAISATPRRTSAPGSVISRCTQA
jgi:hypothetical protein